jgi:hypothetical protein
MNQDEEDVGSFSIEQWLQAQDVSDRDETLDEQCAQMYILHQALASEETGQALARVIIDCDETAIDFIAEMTKSEEPRFAIMALVDLLGALGRSPEHRSRESCHRAVALKRVARAMPCVVRALCEKASSNDICGDAMSYALTLLSFLLGKAGCQERDDLQCVRSIASLEWLKVVMRIWKDPDLVGHVPGEEAPNFRRGLGYLVTWCGFLDRFRPMVYGIRLYAFIRCRCIRGRESKACRYHLENRSLQPRIWRNARILRFSRHAGCMSQCM